MGDRCLVCKFVETEPFDPGAFLQSSRLTCELPGHLYLEALSLDMYTERRFLTLCSSFQPFPCQRGICTAWLLHTFEDFAFLWVPNITKIYARSFLIRTILPFSKANMNTICSQKYNPYHFPFPKTVGVFFQQLNPLLLSSFISTWPGGLKKAAGRRWKYKTGIFE